MADNNNKPQGSDAAPPPPPLAAFGQENSAETKPESDDTRSGLLAEIRNFGKKKDLKNIKNIEERKVDKKKVENSFC